MGAEQTIETTTAAPEADSHRFSRQGLRGFALRFFPRVPLDASADLSLRKGQELGRRSFLGISTLVLTDPGLALTILERLTEGTANNVASQDSGILQREEATLLANIRGYVHPSRIGQLGGIETHQELINRLKGRRRVLRDPFGVNYSWDGLEEFLSGFKRFNAGFRISGGGLEYLDVVSIADLKQSQFSQELVDVYGSRFSDKGLPGYRLEKALGEYYQVPEPVLNIEETRRYGDGMNGIHVAGRSFNNNLYTYNFDADGLLKLFIQNPRVQQTGPLA